MTKKLVVVLGAGSSYELRLPTGNQLRDKIANELNIRFEHGFRQKSGSHEIYEAMKAIAGNDRQPLVKAGHWIREAMPQARSIDTFIDNVQDPAVEQVGKLAIAHCILAAERGSLLHLQRPYQEQFAFSTVADTWLAKFFELLCCRPADLERRFADVAVVNFNYDRCVEHYLVIALRNHYRMPHEQAAALVSKLEVYHPYGTVGALEWQTGRPQVPFGGEPTVAALVDVAGGIKTFTEGTDPEASDIVAIRQAVHSAERVLFLGFAYHRLNMQLLTQPRPSATPLAPGQATVVHHRQDPRRRVFGTAVGISKGDVPLITQDLVRMCNVESEQVFLPETKCKDIFFEFGRGLSLD